MPIPKKLKKFWKILGPGFVTGASDDDPSGIATYSQAGAGFGTELLWTAYITLPLMIVIQEMCARIGLVTKKGLGLVIKENYSKTSLYIIALITIPAIIFNIGADLAGMAAVSNMLVPQIPSYVFCVVFTIMILFSMILFSFQKIASILKWFCLSLLCYIIVPVLVVKDWKTIIIDAFIPTIHWSSEYISIFVAVLGTTISPYLFFWQTSMSVEDHNQKTPDTASAKDLKEMYIDINVGMIFSNLVMFFIILTAGAVLFPAGIKNIETVKDAAEALRPLAGDLSYLLFSVGIIGTGFLAIPVLAGSIAYFLADIFDLKQGMNKEFLMAKKFYIIMSVSLLAGLAIVFIGINPITALIYTAIAYGIICPFLIAFILHICNNKQIMGTRTNTWLFNLLGLGAILLTSFAAIALFIF